MAEVGPAAGAHVDPDAQATVTEFIDYTEHLPSDVRRSLALIEKLNSLVYGAHGEVHELTRQWTARVEPASDQNGTSTTTTTAEQAAVELRARISYQKELGRTYARASLAEARRIDQEVARHQNLLRLTGVKLDALPLPPSRDPTPKPVLATAQGSPQATRDKENVIVQHGPKIKLRLDKNRISAHTTGARGRGGGMPRPRQRRVLVVPGEVLPPPNPNSPTPSAFSDWESTSPAFTLSPEPQLAPPPKRKYKKHKKVIATVTPGEEGVEGSTKLPKKKQERAPRDPNKMGTNVHSAVAGISTSNALLLLTPPPVDPQPGSRHAPWMRLTEYEMAKLRKRMKKNAVWTPSDTMIRRELNDAGRGPENYMRAKKHAEETGGDMLDQDNLENKVVGELKPGEIALGSKSKLMNKGMSLNAQKKQKKALLAQEEAKEQTRTQDGGSVAVLEAPPKEPKLRLKEPSRDRGARDDDRDRKSHSKATGRRSSAKQTPENAKQAARFRAETVESQLSMLGPQLRNLFARPGEGGEDDSVSPAAAPAGDKIVLKTSGRGASRKRKRDSGSAAVAAAAAAQLSEESQLHSQLHSEIVVTPTASPATGGKQSKKRKVSGPDTGLSPLAPATTTTTTKIPLAAAAPSPSKDASGPGTRSEARRPSLVIKPPAPPSRRSSRNSTPASRPPSRSSARLRSSSSSSAASSRRASTASQHQQLQHRPRSRRKSNTPAAPAPATLAGSRSRRPAPGPVTSSQEGGYAISIGKRQKKPGKKATNAASRRGHEKEAAEDVDPNEERYCVCGDVSWGTMVACENEECENAWFHLECVGLADIPPRRTKWWCPDCAAKLGKNKA